MRALIYDFDGVIADSEVLASRVLAEHISALGRPTSLDDALARYTGRRAAEVLQLVAADVGRPPPDDFAETLLNATLERFRSELREVEGASAFIARFADHPRCIASSSSPMRLAVCLEALGLASTFEGRVFSAEMVERGKPHPDLFLFAADRIGVTPSQCVVIEDSALGVEAARAAGMMAIGLTAASHIREGHADRLRAAGAAHVAASWRDVATILTTL